MTSPSSLSRHTLSAIFTRSLTLVATLLLSLHVLAGQAVPAQSDASASAVAFGMHPCVHAAVSGTSVSTALGQCSAPSADAASVDHFEADLRYGSFNAHQTDLVPYDFSAVPLVRSYLSRSTPFEGTALDGDQPQAFGLNTARFFDGMAVETKTIERHGNHTFQQVRSPRGGSVRLAYDDRSRIWEADDDRDNTTRYFYGSDGMLCYVFNTAGMVRHYTYAGTQMIAVEDEHRRTLVRNSYTAGHLTAQQYANGDVYKYAYTWLPDRTAANSVTVTLPDHSTRVVSLATAAQSTLATQ